MCSLNFFLSCVSDQKLLAAATNNRKEIDAEALGDTPDPSLLLTWLVTCRAWLSQRGQYRFRLRFEQSFDKEK